MPVAHHHPVSVLVALLSVLCEKLCHFGFHRLAQHLLGSPACDLFQDRPRTLCFDPSDRIVLHERIPPDSCLNRSSEDALFSSPSTTSGHIPSRRQQEIVDHFDHRTATAAVEVTDEIAGTMVVCIDAGKTPIKGNERVDKDNRRRYDREFRDVKVASISALKWDDELQEPRCADTSYVAGIEHADEFFRRVWVEMNRRSSDLSKLCLVFIGDGADWIWPRVAELDNDTSCRILDFCHAAGHLADVCKLLDGEGTERCRERFTRWRAHLGDSGPGQLLTEMEQERDAALGSAKRDAIQAQINYLEANRQRMNYHLYRDDGLPIGSGAVESACKNVAARMKRSGMTWTLAGAKHLLQLRVSLMSSRFDRDFRRSLPSLPDLHDLPAAA